MVAPCSPHVLEQSFECALIAGRVKYERRGVKREPRAGMMKVVLLLFCVAVLLTATLAQDPWEHTVEGELRGRGDYANHHVGDVPILMGDGMTFHVEVDKDECDMQICWTNMINAPKEQKEWPVRSWPCCALLLAGCCEMLWGVVGKQFC